jgi:phosphatidate cytidylyltransferase
LEKQNWRHKNRAKKNRKDVFVMKTRVITGLVAAALPLAALFFVDSPLLGIFCAVFGAMASYEICHVTKVRNKAMVALAAAVAALVAPTLEYRLFERFRLPPWFFLLVYVFVMVLLMLVKFGETRFEHLLYALLASLGAPAALAMLVVIRNAVRERAGEAYEKNLAAYVIFLTLCCAMLTDTFAYFAGSRLGRHKLCPKISPKKTWEGAVGGVLGTALANMGFAVLFNAFFLHGHALRPVAIGLVSVPVCVVSIIGDLAASALKRNCGAKDFGHLFPGHGGVMDRLDSLSYVAPFMFTLLQLENSMGLRIFYKAI